MYQTEDHTVISHQSECNSDGTALRESATSTEGQETVTSAFILWTFFLFDKKEDLKDFAFIFEWETRT